MIVVSNQNITLSLPEEDLREARILAASRGTSVSQLLARMLRELVDQETGSDYMSPEIIRIHPERVISWGLGDDQGMHGRDFDGAA